MSPGHRRLDDEQLGALLEKTRSGDRSSLDAVVRDLTPLLWHVARSQGLDSETSADVVQTTWLKLLRALDAIRAPGALVSWLVTTTKREAWRVAKAQRVERPVGDDAFFDEPDVAPGPEERVVASTRDRELWEAVERLPQRCRQLLRIVAYLHRPDYGVVSAALGMPRGSIGPQRGRCLDRLRALLSTKERDR
ncbi:sigma-70 family RNA polymerase sigma factor [Umezawaea sp.]|uniref:RNA polymerase sigma factor n=1 Tax=Umezawaea sp. TaxID=1955258 RepID=UPI002ED2B51B